MKLLSIFLMLATAAVLLSACPSKTATNLSSTSSTPSPTPYPVGVISDSAGFTVTPMLATGVDYYWHQQSSFSATNCKIDQSDSVTTDLFCILDVPELDLYFNGVTFDYNVPTTMCTYASVKLYTYWGYQPPPATYSPVLTTTASNCAGTSQGMHYNGSSIDACPYDYSKEGGPNCCEVPMTVNCTPASTAVPSPTPSSFTVWGSGTVSKCLSGPGMSHTISGYPVTTIIKTENTGTNASVTIPAPIGTYSSNIPIANDYLPFGTSYTMSTTPYTAAFFPDTTNPRTDFRYYEFACMDAAYDYAKRIHIVIRSWDQIANWTAQSNPYTDPTQEPDAISPYHDFKTWTDVINNKAGSGGYPSFSQ